MSTANELTNAIIKYLNLCGCHVWRNQTIGVAGRRLPNASRGIGDIIGITSTGRHIEVEVKVGADKIRPEQEKHGQTIQDKHGIYIVAKTFDEFEKQWQSKYSF